MPLVDLVILALATYRLSIFIAEEGGPWDFMARFRAWAGVYYDEYSQPQGNTMLARMLSCVYCNSIWVGVLLVAIWRLAPIWLLIPFALSGVAIIIYKEK